MHLYLVIPARNEEKRIEKTLRDYLLLQNYLKSFTLTVISDSSTDSTESIVKSYMGKYHDLRLQSSVIRRGKGGAIIYGFNYLLNEAKDNDIIGFVDADDSVNAKEVQRLVNFLAKDTSIDCIIGTRRCKHKAKNITFIRSLFSRSYNVFVRILFQLKISDTQCGCKFVKVYALRKIINKLTIKNVVFDLNLLYELKHAHYSIKEVCVNYFNAPGGIKPQIFKIFKTTLEYRIFGYKFFKH
mgnify:CR=1 FL=1